MTTPDRTRVLLLSPALDAVSGVSTHARMLMASALGRQVEYLHFQVGSEGRSESRLGLATRILLSPLGLATRIARDLPDIVHINTSLLRRAYWRDLAYLVVSRLLGRRVLLQIHGGLLPQDFVRGVLARWILRRSLVAADEVTVLTNEELAAYRNFDPRMHVSMIPNAIELGGLLDVPRRQRAAGDPLRIAYVGRIVRVKGLFEAVEALAALPSSVRFEFRIAGSGPDAAELQARIDALGLGDRVRLVGPMFGAAKNALWLSSDVFLFPTYHKEGLPYAVLEALAAGCVPVTTDVGGIKDVMQSGTHGVFVPERNVGAVAAAIEWLAQNPDEAGRMSRAGRERVAVEYGLSTLAHRFGDAYARLGASGLAP